ncbi:MAG: DUF4058 family protein [Planctomycetaceae bacterium]
MRSPFPGMDPFLEDQADPWWSRSDTGSNSAVVTWTGSLGLVGLHPQSGFAIRSKNELPADGKAGLRMEDRQTWPRAIGQSLMAEERRETYLVIRERTSFEVVTVLETLSPANKQTTADGHREYLKKREELLESKSHFIELDLLRGGQRMPLCEPRPRGDFFAMISRVEKRPRVEVFAWTLRQRMPVISVPLAKGDPDVKLELQAVFDTVYVRAHYELSLNYQTELRPTLNADEAAWIRERITQSTASIP